MEAYLMQLATLATSLSKLNMHPHFEAVHYILMCMLFRKDDCENLAPSFCRKHLVASWFGSMILCFSGSIVSNLLIGEALIIPFKYHENIILASVIWFLVNYSPIGMTLKVLNLTFIRIILNTFWCLFIVNKVQSGVMYGVKHYPGAYFIIVALGVSKGAGHLFMNAVLKAIKGTYVERDNEFLFLSTHTKCCFLASSIFYLLHYNYIPNHHPPSSFAFIVVAFFLTNFTDLLSGDKESGGKGLLGLVENLIYTIFFCNPLLFQNGGSDGGRKSGDEDGEDESDDGGDDGDVDDDRRKGRERKMKKN